MKNKKIVILILMNSYMMTNITACVRNNTIVPLIGKTFQAEVETIYGKMEGGGFNKFCYCYLQFEKDSVVVTHRHIYTSSVYGNVTKSDESKSKTYSWKLYNEEVIIENFNDYGQLIFKANQIIGKNRFGGDLVFNINIYVGKIFRAIVRESCGKTLNGGFMDYTYCYLRFEMDSVEITYRTMRIEGIAHEDVSNESKTYCWKPRDNGIIIENFSDYERFTFREDQIIAKDKFGKDLIFDVTK